MRTKLFLSLMVLVALVSCTIVRHDQPGTPTATSANSGEFDSVGYVEKTWAGQVLPELSSHAADLKTVLAALKTNPDAARTQYGRRQEDSAPYTFIVKGSIAVKAAHLDSAAATLELAVAAPTEDGAVLLQIGPVIKTSAIRDSLSFVHFGDFTNQVDFANLSRALNAQVANSVVKALDREHLVGKTISFTGAFAEDASGLVLITPVAIEVAP